MSDNKNESSSHFRAPKIPAPPILGLDGTPHQSEKEYAQKTETKNTKAPSLMRWFKGRTKKQKILIIVALVIFMAGSAFASWYFVFRTPPQEPAPVVVEKEEPPATTEPSRLTGLEVGFEVNKRPVTAVMIENSPEARPQSGLREAGVIYEAVAEGGITRFMALFQDTLPKVAGPVRSVRPYYLDYMVPYDAGIAHVGGSAVALEQVRTQKLKDLDQFFNPGPYWRDRARYAPHNMYTDVNQLLDLQLEKGWKASDYPGLVRGAESKPASTITAKSIGINPSRSLYAVDYAYDAASNTYKRTMGGRPHTDAQSKKQLAPKVVVVPIVPRSQDGIYSVYGTHGTGQVLVFQNGTVIEGTWKKSKRSSQLTLLDSDGNPLELAPGQTWITLAASRDQVTYTP